MSWKPGDRVRCVSPAYGVLYGTVKAVGKTWADVSWSHPDGTHRLVSQGVATPLAPCDGGFCWT
jgi:hypothetical protein